MKKHRTQHFQWNLLFDIVIPQEDSVRLEALRKKYHTSKQLMASFCLEWIITKPRHGLATAIDAWELLDFARPYEHEKPKVYHFNDDRPFAIMIHRDAGGFWANALDKCEIEDSTLAIFALRVGMKHVEGFNKKLQAKVPGMIHDLAMRLADATIPGMSQHRELNGGLPINAA